MRRALYALFPILYCLSLSLSISAQVDTTFWFAPPEISSGAGDTPIKLRLNSYDSPSTVTISQPANGAFSPITLNLPANTTDSVDLTPFLSDVETTPSDQVLNTGLRIDASEPISATYEVNSGSSKAHFILKGMNGVGTEFYTPFQNYWGNGSASPAPYSSFDIVATRNNTTLLISPREDVNGHPSGTSYQVNLDSGQTYSAEDVDPDSIPHLGGSIISSSKPFAVTIKEDQLLNNGCTDPAGDQIVPVERLGKEYVIHKASADSERVFVLTVENGTTIEVDDGNNTDSVWLNNRETYSYPLDQPFTHLQTNKPVYVYHVSGFGCQLDASILPPVNCTGKNDIAFSRNSSDSLIVNLLIRSGSEGDFTVNGNASVIDANDFTVVPGMNGNYMGARVSLLNTASPVSAQTVISNPNDIYGMSVVHGNRTNGARYGHLTGFDATTVVDAGPDQTICANTTLQLNGTIEGGPQNGVWTTDGSGTFSDNTNLNATYSLSFSDKVADSLRFVLTSTGQCESRSDTMYVQVTPAPTVSAGADQVICANESGASLNGSVTGGATTGVWSTSGSGSFNPDSSDLSANYLPSNADTASGSVTLILTSTNNGGCNPESDTMALSITPAPKVTATPDTTVCANVPSIPLKGEVYGGASQGEWSTSGAGVFTPNNVDPNAEYQPGASDTANGSVTIYYTSSDNGSCQPVTDSLLITFTPAPVVEAGIGQTICDNAPVVDLSGSVSGPTNTGVWSGGNGSFSPSDSSLQGSYIPSNSELSSGTVTLTLTSTNNGGCIAESDNMTISVEQSPIASINTSNGCEGTNVVFNDNSSATSGNLTDWKWNFGDGDSSSIQDPVHQYDNDGTFTVQMIVTASNGCTDTATGTSIAHDIPVAGFRNQGFCLTNGVRMDFFDTSTVNNDSIQDREWDLGYGPTAYSDDPTVVYPNTNDRNVRLIVTSSAGCEDTISRTLAIEDPPEADFTYQAESFNTGSVIDFRDLSQRSSSWEWYFGDNSFPKSTPDPEHIYDAGGTYTVTQIVRNSIGCVDSASRTIEIAKELVVFPNAISPNGDGKNDTWRLQFMDVYPDGVVKVFNRWGEEVFSSVGYTENWDGTHDGKELPEGTYYYLIDLKNGEEPMTGPVTLVR